MNNLTFCGFVTLKNKLKESVLNSIKDLKKFNCDLIITTGDNVYNTLSIGFASSIIVNKNKNVFSLDKDDKNRIIITKLYGIKKIDEEEKDFKENKSLLDKFSKFSTKGLSIESYKSKESVNIARSKRNKSHYEKFRFNLDSEKRKLNPDKMKSLKGSIEKKKNINEKYEKLFDKSSRFFSLNTDTNENNKEIDMNLNSNIFNKYNKSIVSEKIQKMNSSRKIKSLLVKEIISNKSNKNKDRKCNELNNIYYYYPEIFEENEDFANDSIYCVSGKAFYFLYKNKDKKNCKYLLEKINKNIKIFYSMSSLDKSMAIDYYREITDRCICTIGKCQSDYDAILTSNVGVSLEAPKNINTIFSHFYSKDSSVLSIKNIIREGRIYGENNSLLKLACFIYSIILNIYILVCFFLEYEEYILKKAVLEIVFFILSIAAFTAQSENFNISNCLIQNKKLYYNHYLSQEIGILLLKISTLFFQSLAFIRYPLTDRNKEKKIICSYFYVFSFEQIFSTVFTINHIYFYRKNPLYNSFFVVMCLLILINGLIIFTLNGSNFKYDILNIEFEFNEDLVDSIGDERKLNYFLILFGDFVVCFIYSRIIQFIFDKIAQKESRYLLS